MAFQAFSSLISTRLKQNGLSGPVLAAQTIVEANKLLQAWYGEAVTDTRIQAVSVKYQRLCFASLDASLRQELKLREAEFVQTLNTRLGSSAIKELQVLV